MKPVRTTCKTIPLWDTEPSSIPTVLLGPQRFIESNKPKFSFNLYLVIQRWKNKWTISITFRAVEITKRIHVICLVHFTTRFFFKTAKMHARTITKIVLKSGVRHWHNVCLTRCKYYCWYLNTSPPVIYRKPTWLFNTATNGSLGA